MTDRQLSLFARHSSWNSLSSNLLNNDILNKNILEFLSLKNNLFIFQAYTTPLMEELISALALNEDA
jgi:hypothetical protein